MNGMPAHVTNVTLGESDEDPRRGTECERQRHGLPRTPGLGPNVPSEPAGDGLSREGLENGNAASRG